jgi:hypothetical protein
MMGEAMTSPGESWEGNREDDGLLPSSSTVSFLHAVGQSSLRQGLAVPLIAQISWLKGIAKGQCVPVTILFGDGWSVPASLRRINNARGHLQFRYESRQQSALRDYLNEVFCKFDDCKNGLLRVSEVQPRVFLFDPVSVAREKTAHLALFQPHFHRFSKQKAERLTEFKELQECFRAVQYDETHG